MQPMENPRAPSTQPPRVVPEPLAHGDELALADVIHFFRSNWLLVFGAALAAAILTALVVLFVLPEEYEASATLVIVPPTFTAELKPATLTVQGYQRLLEADAVIHEAKTRLVDQGALSQDDPLRLGDELGTRIFVSRRAEDTALAPMIHAIARAREPELAATIANTWAGVFLEKTRALVAGTTSETVRFIETQYPVARQRSISIEEERLATANELHQRLDAAADRWDERLTDHRQNTEGLLADYRAATASLIEEFRSTNNLETRREQIRAVRATYSELQSEEGRIHAQLERKRLEHQAAKRQLEETPQFFELQKAMSDEALWQALAAHDGRSGRGGIDWSALQGRTLVTQELSPVFLVLAQRVSNLEMEVDALEPRREQLRANLSEMSEELAALEQELGGLDTDLEKLTLERQAGRSQLLDARLTGLKILERRARQEVEAIERERETRLAQLDRDIEQQSEFYTALAQSFNQAHLAEAQQDFEDVRLGAPAVPRAEPEGRGALIKSLISGVIGALLGLMAAVVRGAEGRGAAPREH
jgi:capsular polysaccharide biosynthesis protein